MKEITVGSTKIDVDYLVNYYIAFSAALTDGVIEVNKLTDDLRIEIDDLNKIINQTIPALTRLANEK